MPPGGRENRNLLLTVIATIAVVAALRASYSVTMPLAAAIVVIAAIWPIKSWLDQVLPSGVSYLGTVLILMVIVVGFAAAVYFSAAQVVQAFAKNWDQLAAMLRDTTHWAERWGVPIGGQQVYGRLVGFGQEVLSNLYTMFAYLGFIALLVMLGLPQVPSLRRTIDEHLDTADRRELGEAVDAIARKIRQYLGVTTLTSALTGAASALWAVAMGLDLALVWGVLNFLLNYVPVIGNVIGILPPTLYALIQFQSWESPIVILVGLIVIQITISNFVYPMLQGRSLSLSPVAIVLALAFWSWVWGIAGALIAVPLTVTLVIICEHFPRARWIAAILSPDRRLGDGG